ncbi:MAG: isopentenyl-diphosphate Delta-isomerase [Gammaproteobacteria bacterium]
MVNHSQSQVILVDEQDREIGIAEKMLAHQQAKLHRAFSVFIFRHHQERYELLLQQRQTHKYHSGGLWTNTCCSHPAPGETVLAAAQHRLQQEMGIMADLQEVGCFHYTASVGNQLVENEMDHVLIGIVNHAEVRINPEEVANYRWLDLAALQHELDTQPQHYTAWFAQALQLALANVPALNLNCI